MVASLADPSNKLELSSSVPSVGLVSVARVLYEGINLINLSRKRTKAELLFSLIKKFIRL